MKASGGPPARVFELGFAVLSALIETRRHDRDPSARPILAVLDDHLTLLVEIGGPVRSLMVRGCTTALKPGVVPVLGLHNDTADSRGVGRHGKGLVAGFAKVWVVKTRPPRHHRECAR